MRKINKKSLNYEKRLRDHKQIILENEAMLQRLQNKKSYFNVINWTKDEKQRKKYLGNITNYNGSEEREHAGRMQSTIFGNTSRSYFDNNLNGGSS